MLTAVILILQLCLLTFQSPELAQASTASAVTSGAALTQSVDHSVTTSLESITDDDLQASAKKFPVTLISVDSVRPAHFLKQSPLALPNLSSLQSRRLRSLHTGLSPPRPRSFI